MTTTYRLVEDNDKKEYWKDTKSPEISGKLFKTEHTAETPLKGEKYIRHLKVDNVNSNIKIVKKDIKYDSIVSRKHRFYPTPEQADSMEVFFKGYNHYYNVTVNRLKEFYEPQYEAAEQKYKDGICSNCDKPRLDAGKMCAEHIGQRPNFKFQDIDKIQIRNHLVHTTDGLNKEENKHLKWLLDVPQVTRVTGCFAACRAYDSSVKLYKKGYINKFNLKLKDESSPKIFTIESAAVHIRDGEVVILPVKLGGFLKMSNATKKYLPSDVNCESMVVCQNSKYYFISVNNYTKNKIITVSNDKLTSFDELKVKMGLKFQEIKEAKVQKDLKKKQDAAAAANKEEAETTTKPVKEEAKSSSKKAVSSTVTYVVNRNLDLATINSISEDLKIIKLNLSEMKPHIDRLSDAIKNFDLINDTLPAKERTPGPVMTILKQFAKEYDDKYKESNDRCNAEIRRVRQDRKFILQKQITAENKTRDNVISLDPGAKTFQTGYDPSGNIYKFGVKDDLYFIKMHHKKHDKFKSLLPLVTCKTRKNMKRKILKLNAKLTNQIAGFHNDTAVFLARNYGNVIYPHLNTANLIRKNSKRIAETNDQNEKHKLHAINRQYHALSHYKFKLKLKRTCKKYGSSLHECEEFYTTQTCGNCGVKNDVKSADVYNCSACLYKCDRDTHGARNILIRQLTFATRL